MPNGHGGAPFLGAPLFLAVTFAILVVAPVRDQLGWAWVAACLLCAALAGWRFAYHLHMRHADEYGGAYASADVYKRALLRYRILAVPYILVAVAAGFAVLWWRGLP